MNDALTRARIVLCRTSHPGNIGAAARALKTMGLERLCLVAPRAFPHPDATARASGAGDVLDAAVVVPTLADALQDTVLAVAFTARRRELAAPMRWLRDAAAEAAAAAAHGEVALVFGAEAAGLSNEELALCHMPAMIPANPEYASLNLAAAVQLACYELRLASAGGAAPDAAAAVPASFDEVEALLAHLQRGMIATGFLDPARPGRLMPRLRRLFGRSRLEREEVNILRGMLRALRPDIE
jgi:tRNA/rRNA methyltransferase